MKRSDNLKKEKIKENRLKTAFLLNLSFSIFEIIGGFFTNSVALISDSIHDFGDSVSLGLSWFLSEKSKKKPDERYTFGYARYSLLGGLISAIILVAGSTWLIVESIPRIINPEPINIPWVIGFSIVGIIINGLAAFKTAKGSSLNEKMVSLHLLEDVAGWVALLTSAIIMSFVDIPILDPLLSIVFTLIILRHVYKNVKAIIVVFLEKAPKGIDVPGIINQLKSNPNIIDVHHVHIWTLEGNLVLMTLHVVMKDYLEKEQVVIEQKWIHHLLADLGVNHATIEIECDNHCINQDCNPVEDLDLDNHDHHHH